MSARNVVVTQLHHLQAPQEGVQIRLLETEGRPVTFRVTAWRDFRSGWQTDFIGQRQAELSIGAGQIEVEIGAYQWVQVEAIWEP